MNSFCRLLQLLRKTTGQLRSNSLRYTSEVEPQGTLAQQDYSMVKNVRIFIVPALY